MLEKRSKGFAADVVSKRCKVVLPKKWRMMLWWVFEREKERDGWEGDRRD